MSYGLNDTDKRLRNPEDSERLHPVLAADCVEEDSSHICQKAEPRFFLARDIGPKTQGL